MNIGKLEDIVRFTYKDEFDNEIILIGTLQFVIFYQKKRKYVNAFVKFMAVSFNLLP